MIARPIPAVTGAEAVRAVRALGSHRYVQGRLHAIHALVFDALEEAYAATTLPESLVEACAWARRTLEDADIDAESKDPRLFRTASGDELTAALQAFWTPGDVADRAHERLLEQFQSLGFDVPTHTPFDEAAEEGFHPLLIDAGWELVPLAELDVAKHRGVIEAFGEPILYEAARFEEESAIPKVVSLQELPAIGLVELVGATDEWGDLVEPFVVWTEGNETYQDYLVRGVIKAAKLTPA